MEYKQEKNMNVLLKQEKVDSLSAGEIKLEAVNEDYNINFSKTNEDDKKRIYFQEIKLEAGTNNTLMLDEPVYDKHFHDAEMKCEYEVTLKCTLCVVKFLDEDAYEKHMVLHTIPNGNDLLKYTGIYALHAPSSEEKECHKFWMQEPSATGNVATAMKTESELDYKEVDTKEGIIQIDKNVQGKKPLKRKNKIFGNKNIAKKNHVGVVKPNKIAGVKRSVMKKRFDDSRRPKSNELIKPFSCRLCEYKGRAKGDLVAHMRCHTDERRHPCTLCPSKFRNSGHLNRHMLTHSGEKPHACSLCNRKFAQRCTLKKHMGTHTGEKPFSCDLCSYKSTSLSILGVHLRCHTGERPFACEVCDYRSKTTYSLATHMRIHTGEKPFSCKICHYKSTRSSQLVRHMRTHTGEKRFSCKLCNYKCTRHCNLAKHLRLHGGNKYSCDACGYTSATRATFVAHIKTHE